MSLEREGSREQGFADLPETEDYLVILVLLHGGKAIAIGLAYVIRILADVAVAFDQLCRGREERVGLKEWKVTI